MRFRINSRIIKTRKDISRTISLTLSIGLGLAVGLVLSFYLGWSLARDRLVDQADDNAQMRALALEGMLATQRAVATVISGDAQVSGTLVNAVGRAEVSRKLEQLRRETGSAVIYLLDRDGTAVAASNWEGDESFIGVEYAFRDYFNLAVSNGVGYQFTSGVVTKRPGLHLSNSVERDGKPVGVVVVKIEFDQLQALWAASSDETIVTDANGRAVISSNPDYVTNPERWGYGAFTASKIIGDLDGWTLRVGVSQRVALSAGIVAMIVFLSIATATGLILMRIRQARRKDALRLQQELRHRDALERAVDERTAELTAEIGERTSAERRLAELQSKLIQANKLATLGQVTAGVAHEVNQPLAAIRLLADNSLVLSREGPSDLGRNLSMIIRMTERIELITASLRRFARKAGGHLAPLRIDEAIDNSVLLTSTNPQTRTVRLIVEPFDRNLTVLAEAVPLEQILVNLIHNAYEALTDTDNGEIRIVVMTEVNFVELFVSDNGPGLAEAIAANLFEPFTTSKPQGVGLGLVIARDIARNFSGDLHFVSGSGAKGARFRLRLNRP